MNKSIYYSRCCSVPVVNSVQYGPYQKHICSECERDCDVIGVIMNHALKKSLSEFARDNCDHFFDSTGNCKYCGHHIDDIKKAIAND